MYHTESLKKSLKDFHLAGSQCCVMCQLASQEAMEPGPDTTKNKQKTNNQTQKNKKQKNKTPKTTHKNLGKFVIKSLH